MTARFDRAPVATSDAASAQFAADVQYYLALQPRQLPSRYLYDALGSALFDAICRLPWYRITRAETALLTDHGRDIFRRMGRVDRIVELGGGTGEKLTALVESGRVRTAPLDVDLIDISADALALSARALSALPGVRVFTHHTSYEAGLDEIRGNRGAGPTLVLLLGSNIGNFDPPNADAFLRGIRGALRKGDALLIGADLVKPEAELLLAYDDPLGVTAAFNRNLLVRINRDLAADFDLASFEHRAIWNASDSRVEMHLVSTRRQCVQITQARLDLTFERGESIWTESSYKYRVDQLTRMLERAGFTAAAQWVDEESRFALTLAAAA